MSASYSANKALIFFKSSAETSFSLSELDVTSSYFLSVSAASFVSFYAFSSDFLSSSTGVFSSFLSDFPKNVLLGTDVIS